MIFDKQYFYDSEPCVVYRLQWTWLKEPKSLEILRSFEELFFMVTLNFNPFHDYKEIYLTRFFAISIRES